MDAATKQQIRQQAEVNLDEMFQWQSRGIKGLERWTNDQLNKQYRRLNRVKSQRFQRREKRIGFLKKVQNKMEAFCDQITDQLPQPVGEGLLHIQFLGHQTVRAAEAVEDQIDHHIYERWWAELNRNRGKLDEALQWMETALESNQTEMKQTLLDQLSRALPLTEDERLLAARDITNKVQRRDV